jgi:hypothetical protein
MGAAAWSGSTGVIDRVTPQVLRSVRSFSSRLD